MRALSPHHDNCLGCGPANPGSFGLRFETDGERIFGTASIGPQHEGAPGFAHGGGVSTILDDTLGTMLIVLRRPAVTARLEVDFRAPVLVREEPYAVEAWVERLDGRKLQLAGELRDGETVLAAARALFVEVSLAHWGERLPEAWRRNFERGDAELPR